MEAICLLVSASLQLSTVVSDNNDTNNKKLIIS